jgi:hypothetical protein
MSEMSSIRRRPLALLISLLLVAVVVWCLSFPRIAGSKRVRFSTDTNGHPVLLGLPLANTNVQNAVFWAMGKARIKASIAGSPLMMTNATQQSNYMQTLHSMSRAGLFFRK